MFFDHIKEIICSGDEYEYDVVRKFFASSCVGHKLKVALVWQSKEQTGKGTVLNYMNNLLGKRMCKTSSVETVEHYTKPFEGCSLINLDELPVFGTSKFLQDKMKSHITEEFFDCRAMHCQGYAQRNTFNFVITSNNNSISLSQTNKERYFVNTINERYIGNVKYFDKLHKAINDEDVKVLIFQEFVRIYEEEVKPKNWIGNYLKPTKAGKLKIIEALPTFFKWIKSEYLLNGFGIDDKCSELVARYQEETKDKTSSNKLARWLLQDMGAEVKDIKVKQKNGMYVRDGRRYILSYEKLKEFYEKNEWLDELTEVLPEESCETQINEESDEETMFVDKTDKADYVRSEDYKMMQKELNKKIQRTNDTLDATRKEYENAIQYIKQLEQRINEMEKEDNNIIPEKKPRKKVNKKVKPTEDVIEEEPKDFVEVADGTLLNKTTGKTYEITDLIDDDEKIF
jgi:exonuclease VII small subunit